MLLVSYIQQYFNTQFWQIGFESCWLQCSKCRILVLLRYCYLYFMFYFLFLFSIIWIFIPCPFQKKNQTTHQIHKLSCVLSFNRLLDHCVYNYRKSTCPVFGRHQFFGTSEHYGKALGSLLSGWMNYNYTACCWFPTSNNILILPSQFWQIRFESYWLHCSKCRILVLLRYYVIKLQFCQNSSQTY